MGYASKNQGFYKLRYPEKYVGDPSKIRFMSSWELSMHKFLDGNPNILRWSSEELAIPYIKPTDGKVHKYYPDYWIEYKNQKGEIVREVIEVKPESQTRAPKSTKRKKKTTHLRESITYAVNTAKWKACQEFCDKYGFRFRIVTENSGLFR